MFAIFSALIKSLDCGHTYKCTTDLTSILRQSMLGMLALIAVIVENIVQARMLLPPMCPDNIEVPIIN